MEIPTLQTARLTLRGHRAGDFPDCFAMWSDPEVTRHIGGKPSTRPQTWMRMLTYIGHWSLLGFGYWAIEEKATGKFVGESDSRTFAAGRCPRCPTCPKWDGRSPRRFTVAGTRRKRLAGAIAWADGHFESPRTVCMIDCENAASVRVAEKCGYRTFERTIIDDRATLFLERMRE